MSIDMGAGRGMVSERWPDDVAPPCRPSAAPLPTCGNKHAVEGHVVAVSMNEDDEAEYRDSR